MPKYKPQLKHQAMHGGYYKKPTQKEVKANLNFWAGAGGYKNGEIVGHHVRPSGIPKTGTQLKLF